ncbi:hypothetical protein A2619_01910 [candidate division WWE3 bacterium RIFOXYD1_FULL_39_9]|uniref:N(4)-bis(aminopropyl)spermidine synthase C-terminal domain-containing protein n=1 Tax=candidate division WWE3 bacterium RIFOXYD1_FULL_39_9 TaxID=1802649 RepID=A0A1F4X7B6_UNCKA|nr:MAG: hypothetical protein A2619_01910 [candidate division WWE3 bacterium RIFOXYD1_FULL_39_9]
MVNIITKIKESNKELKNREIEGILYLLLTSQNLKNNDLIKQTGLPKETLKAFKASISYMLEDPTKDLLILKTQYQEELSALNLRSYAWSLLPEEDKDLAQKLRDIRSKYNLNPKREFDQFFATEETSIAKAKMILNKCDVEGKDIALLGDDDLVSISLFLIGANPKSVVVFDIDADILSAIETVSATLGIENVRTVQYDFRNNPDSRYLEKFDIVVTDPPYTSSGIKLFLNRAVQLLAKSLDYTGKYIFLYYGNSFKSPEKTLKIQDIINRFHLVIEDRINKFARYNGAESIGSASSVYVLKATPFTTELSDLSDFSDIYTYSDVSEEKFPYVDQHTFKVLGVSATMLKSKSALQKAAGEFCKLHRLRVVDSKITNFKGDGFTLTFVLSNSNLLFHTWPELSAVHVDLITCSPIYNENELSRSLMRLFDAKFIESRKVE